MPIYVLPSFNLNINIWRSAHLPATHPPDVTAMGNLALGKRVAAAATGGTSSRGTLLVAPLILLPALTDIRCHANNSAGDDWVEIPAGSGRMYLAVSVDDIGKGFSNEHRYALVYPAPPWPVPYP